MKEFEITPTLKIKRKGIFNLEGLYNMAHSWLEINGFTENFKETEYTEKTTPRGKDIEIDWNLYYDISSYVRYKIKISFMANGITKVALEKGNKKVEMDKGSIEIKIESNVIYDPKDEFKKNVLTFPFIWFYENKMKKRLEGYKLELYKRIYNLHKEIKLYLDMNQF